VLGAGDVRYLRRFAACALRHERSQLGLGYTQSRALSRGVTAALNEFVTLAYLKNHHPTAAARTERLVADTFAARRAMFGIASRRDLLFDHNDPNGADLGIVVVTCPLRGGARRQSTPQVRELGQRPAPWTPASTANRMPPVSER
jgi:hypothetical protein